MKLTKKLEKEVMAVYEAYWDSYLNGDMKTMASFIDDDFNVIGTTLSEVFINKKEVMNYYKATADQIAGKVELRNRGIKMLPAGGQVLITELNDLYILIEKEWVFYSKARLSSLLGEREDGWKFIHQHGSIPDSKAQEGEQVAFEKISRENIELRDAVKRRTVELENKNRELEIEAALERVRAKAMAMHKSDDLTAAVGIVFSELERLGFKTERCGIGIFNDHSGKVYVWTTSSNDRSDKVHLSGDEILEGHPLLEGIFNAWKNQQDYSYVLKGKDLINYYEVTGKSNLPVRAPSEHPENTAQYYYCAMFPAGGLFAFREEEFSDDVILLMKRFSDVFHLTFTRHLDLREAEAQAREAKIEAALERVRAKAMAMHNSDDLALTVDTFFSELTSLKVTPHRCGVGIIDKKSRTVDIKANTTTHSKKIKKVSGTLKLSGHPVLSSIFENWKLQKEYHPVLHGNEIIEYYKIMNPQISFPDFAGDETQYGHYFFFKEGGVFTWTDKDLTENDLNIFRRFTSVLSLTYRRYIDLKNAEAQNVLIQAENERKTRELEEARQMQLAMLPKEVPSAPGLDIAVYMQTATEVGGDYYDFSFKENGSLNIAIGDATGHGMKAGIMVSSMKSIFTTNAPKMDLNQFFKTANNGVKSMKLQRMMMGFAMLNIHKNKLELINAGMPPIFLFCKEQQSFEEISEHGMPIGAMNHFRYTVIEKVLQAGDTILLMTDGLPELKNDNGEMYGYKKIRNGFESIAEKSPDQIIGFLKDEGSAWVNDEAPDDDVTFVVIKVK